MWVHFTGSSLIGASKAWVPGGPTLPPRGSSPGVQLHRSSGLNPATIEVEANRERISRKMLEKWSSEKQDVVFDESFSLHADPSKNPPKFCQPFKTKKHRDVDVAILAQQGRTSESWCCCAWMAASACQSLWFKSWHHHGFGYRGGTMATWQQSVTQFHQIWSKKMIIPQKSTAYNFPAWHPYFFMDKCSPLETSTL